MKKYNKETINIQLALRGIKIFANGQRLVEMKQKEDPIKYSIIEDKYFDKLLERRKRFSKIRIERESKIWAAAMISAFGSEAEAKKGILAQREFHHSTLSKGIFFK